MFRRKKRSNSPTPAPVETNSASESNLFPDLALDDPRHMAHYRFAFGVVPEHLFGPKASEFLKFFLEGDGKAVLGWLWFSRNSEIDIEDDAFEVEQRITVTGDSQFVVNMPEASPEKLEAHFFGIHVPQSVATSIMSGSSDLRGVRLIFLEESFLGFTMIGECTGPGSHENLGSGPEPTGEGMWQVMHEICTEIGRRPQGGVSFDVD